MSFVVRDDALRTNHHLVRLTEVLGAFLRMLHTELGLGGLNHLLLLLTVLFRVYLLH